ncbi:hypothetical protein BIV57_11240 [Mangrovactinospora gilvigrisea]|uniref:HTH cro/C1-type domain-containing protein n=1 Tax=Mangrovactinospora gilvigrisea TaxID=1428644 RepID=A0A1J7C755_9ACTN|nr:helix-turn-helix transcriptional regulator [Mangrovactinospora gilvigrisea]OIV37384.1 hypothetical protein BIV57_11240 [Mangrovactinospora gilvigrisea]
MNRKQIPPEVLERADVRRALAEHDLAAAFKLFTKWAGLSQNALAAATGITPGKISLIIRGRQQVTAFAVICRIADGLRIPGRLLGLADRPWEHQADPALPPAAADDVTAAPEPTGAWAPSRTADLAADLTRNDLMLDRRAATRTMAATLTGAALLDPLEPWLRPAAADATHRPPGRLGRRDVEHLEQVAIAFRHWNHTHGGGLQRKAVLGQLNDVSAFLAHHQQTHIAMGLYRVMAQLASTAASMTLDEGDEQRGQQYYRLALRAAHAGGDMPFGANVLAAMARQLLYRDQPQDALDLVRLAQDGARGTAAPRVRAMLLTREAWAYAAMGRVGAFERATGQAEQALAQAGGSDDDPYWIRYFNAAELTGVTGGRRLDLARTDPRTHAERAADQIRTAIDQRAAEAGRSHVLDRIGLAECHFLTGDLRAAAPATLAAVEVAEQLTSTRVRRQLTRLYAYTVGRHTSPGLREARDRLRVLLAD